MTMNEKLDQLMKERGLNRAELSEQADIPYTTIVNFYAKGTENVKRSTLIKLSRFFDVSMDYLADDTVDERYVAPVVTSAAAHFDPNTLTEEGREMYLNLVQMLAEKYSKSNT